MINTFRLDDKDIEIIRYARKTQSEENRAARLFEVARKVDMNPITARMRILELAASGLLRIERCKNTFSIYVTEAAAEVAL